LERPIPWFFSGTTGFAKRDLKQTEGGKGERLGAKLSPKKAMCRGKKLFDLVKAITSFLLAV